jgi:hypothetical protein
VGTLQSIKVGKRYKAEIDCSSVVGQFNARLRKIEKYNDNEVLEVYDKFDVEVNSYYGVMLHFDNGVYLEWLPGVTLIDEEGNSL